jgi:hypothetical protein
LSAVRLQAAELFACGMSTVEVADRASVVVGIAACAHAAIVVCHMVSGDHVGLTCRTAASLLADGTRKSIETRVSRTASVDDRSFPCCVGHPPLAEAAVFVAASGLQTAS